MTKRDEYIEAAKEKLDGLNAELARLEARANAASGEFKREINSELDELRQAKDRADAKLDELRAAGDAAWRDVKVGAELAWRSLAESIENASHRFK